MKKSDIATIILVASLGVIVSFFVANSFLGDASSEPVSVDTISEIKPEVDMPADRDFPVSGINPSVNVSISGNIISDDENSTEEESVGPEESSEIKN